jgi:hypothetical protein
MIATPPITPMTVPILAPVFIPLVADDVGAAIREPAGISVELDVVVVAAFVVNKFGPVRVVNGTVLACTRAPNRKASCLEQQL